MSFIISLSDLKKFGFLGVPGRQLSDWFVSVRLSNHYDAVGANRRAKTACGQNTFNEERTILTLNKSAINSKLHETKKGKQQHKVELRLAFLRTDFFSVLRIRFFNSSGL